MNEGDEDEDYSDDHIDMFVNDPFDLDDPVCGRCGSTKWSYCTLGDNNAIKKCSDCPRKREIH